MIYLIIFVLSLLIFNNSNEIIKGKNRYRLLFLLWILVLSFQHGVGTDYYNYLKLIDNNILIFNKKEYLFYYMLRFLKISGFDFQLLFFFVSCLQILFTFKYFKKIEEYGIKLIYIIFLYFTLSGVFFNQMNALRQYIAIPLVSIGFLYILEKRYIKFLIIISLASFFHRSSFLCFLIIPFIPILKIKYRKTIYLLIFILTFSVMIFDIRNMLYYVIQKITPLYAHYLFTDFQDKASISSVLVKYLTLPIYIYSVFNLNSLQTKNHIFMYNLGLFSVCLFYIFSEITILLRFLAYFNFFKIFPIYFLINDLKNKNKNLELLIITLYIVSIYLLKIIFFPQREYLYESVLLLKSFYY